MRKILSILLLALLTQITFAQQRPTSRSANPTTSVKGVVYSTNDKAPIPFATVAVYSARDTSLLSGATSAMDGSFEITRIPRGNYILRVSFVGYNTVDKAITISDVSNPLSLGRIEMVQGIELDLFEIKETYIPVQMKEDTVEFSAEAFRAPEGSALEELLKRLPGAEVDKDGKITINGKEIDKILVDGKKFFDDDPKVASKNLPANIIDKVQVFDKASDQAQFTGIDDGESENIINLTIKPGMKKGWFGRATIGGGADLPPGDFRYENSLSLNYFRDNDQLSIIGSLNNTNNAGFTDVMGSGGGMMVGGNRGGFSFGTSGGITNSASLGVNFVKNFSEKLISGGSYQLSNSSTFSERDIFREDIYPTGSTFRTEQSETENKTTQHRLRFEIEYKPDSMNTLTFRPGFTFGQRDYTALGTYQTLSETNDLVNSGRVDNKEESSYLDARMEAMYRHRFAKPRRTLWVSLEGRYRVNDGNANNYSLNDYVSSIDTVDQYVTNRNNQGSWSVRLGYTEPLGKRTALEFRYSMSYSSDDTEKEALSYNPLTGEYTIFDTVYSNNYGNLFYSQRFELRLQRRFDKFNYTIGMGLYPSNSESYVEGASTIPQNVINIAPMFQLNYNWSKQQTLRMHYNGRTNQPTVTQLQPVPDNSDPLSIQVGNPDLKPEFRHDLRVFYNKFNPTKMSSIFAMGFARFTQNAITSVSISDPSLYPELVLPDTVRPGAKISMSENVDYTYSASGHFTYTTPIGKSKFNLSSSTNVNLTNSRSIIDREENIMNNLGAGENLKITYRLERFDFSVSGRFNINSATYSLQPNRNLFYNTVSTGADFNWTIFKNFILSSDIIYRQTSGYSDGFNPTSTNWNAQIAWTIGKHNQGTLRFRVTDILNKNNNTIRNTSDTYIEDVTYNTLGRYFILGLTYNLNQNKSKEAPQNEFRGGRPGPPPGVTIIRH